MLDRGYFYGLIGHRLDVASGRDLLKFEHRSSCVGWLENKVDLVERATPLGCWIGNPIAYAKVAFKFVRAPGDT